MDGKIGVDAPEDTPRDGAAGAGEDAGESQVLGEGGREWLTALGEDTGCTASDLLALADGAVDLALDQTCCCRCSVRRRSLSHRLEWAERSTVDPAGRASSTGSSTRMLGVASPDSSAHHSLSAEMLSMEAADRSMRSDPHSWCGPSRAGAPSRRDSLDFVAADSASGVGLR